MSIPESRWRRLHDGRWGVVLNDNSQHATGDTTRVSARNGDRTTVVLDQLITSGPNWQLWSVLSLQAQVTTKLQQLAKPAPKAVPPTVRRDGQTIALPAVLPPEPPPHTDADAPPPREALRWPSGEEPNRRRVPVARMRFDKHGYIDNDADDNDADEAEAFYDAYLADAGDR